MAFDLLSYGFYGFKAVDLMIAVSVFFATLVLTKISVSLVIRKLRAFSKKTKNEIDDVIVGMISIFGWPFYLLVALYASIHVTAVPAYVKDWYGYLFVIVLSYYAARATIRALEVSIDIIVSNKRRKGEKVDRTILDFFARILKGLVIAIALLFMLSGLGYNVTGIAAGLGIGGIAVAFAVQNILAELFSAFSIYMDRPFELGDFITFGSVSGTVKKIGILTTRLTSLDGEEVVVSNNDIISSTIHNYGRLKKRRVAISIGVTYGTPLSKVKQAKKIIESVIKSVDSISFDRVYLTQLGDYSINFEAVYYVESSDYLDYLKATEKVNMEILKRFGKAGIELAYPTQTIFVRK